MAQVLKQKEKKPDTSDTSDSIPSITTPWISTEDCKKLFESLSPGNYYAVSNFSININRNIETGNKTTTIKSKFDGIDFTVTLSNVRFKSDVLPLEFPELEPEGVILHHNTFGNHDSETKGDVVTWSDEFGLGETEYRSLYVRSGHGNLSRHVMHDPYESQPAQTWIPSLETIMADTRRLKKKYDKWISFEEKTGHWNETVKKAMNGNKTAIRRMKSLGSRSVCIMGTAWKGSAWGCNGKFCSACEKLGYDLLDMFTQSIVTKDGDFQHYYPTVMERFEEYKMMFEWHFNVSHR